MPPATSRATRKRKNSLKPSTFQRKKQKAMHAATQAAPAANRVSIRSNSKSKEKRRYRSTESSSDSPDFSGVESSINRVILASSQKVISGQKETRLGSTSSISTRNVSAPKPSNVFGRNISILLTILTDRVKDLSSASTYTPIPSREFALPCLCVNLIGCSIL
jgi:hypothetical protein